VGGDDSYSPSELVDLAEPFREDPGVGPTQPSTAGAAYDVEFRTIHRSKGDQDDVVVVADPGFDVWSRGPHTRRFVAQGPIAGLAPPTNTDVPDDIAIPPFDGGAGCTVPATAGTATSGCAGRRPAGGTPCPHPCPILQTTLRTATRSSVRIGSAASRGTSAPRRGGCCTWH